MALSSTWNTAATLGRRNVLASAGMVLVAVFVAFALFAPLIAPQNPSNVDLPSRLQPPSGAHWFGTDELGRDIFSRVIYGARISMLVGTSVVAASLMIGLVVGSLAGYYGGWVGYARLIRAQVLATREREFVEAARALGATDLRIIVRHILPNIIQPMIVQAAIGMAGAVLAEATMSFLGLGVPPPTASWGTMLNDGRAHLFDAPHLVLFPALAVMLAVLSFNFIGDALRDLLDPRSRIEAGM